MCTKSFRSSAYWFLMKKSDFPDKCPPCRLANREKLRATLNGEKIKYTEEYHMEVREGGGKGKKGPKGFRKKKIVVTNSSSEVKSNEKAKRF